METAASGQRQSRKKLRRKRPADELVYYVVKITRWDWTFMFGVNHRRDEGEPYSDYRHLELRGRLLRPTAIKADKVELTLLPNSRLNEDKRADHDPEAVGSLQLYRGQLQAIISIPADALATLLQMAIAGRLRYAVCDGSKLRYGHSRLRMCRLQSSIDDDDLPPE